MQPLSFEILFIIVLMQERIWGIYGNIFAKLTHNDGLSFSGLLTYNAILRELQKTDSHISIITVTTFMII